MEEAIRIAVDECLSEGILTEFLEKYRNEVGALFSLMYEEERAIQCAREEGIEIGIERGIEKNAFEAARSMLADGFSVESVRKYTKLDEEKILALR